MAFFWNNKFRNLKIFNYWVNPVTSSMAAVWSCSDINWNIVNKLSTEIESGKNKMKRLSFTKLLIHTFFHIPPRAKIIIFSVKDPFHFNFNKRNMFKFFFFFTPIFMLQLDEPFRDKEILNNHFFQPLSFKVSEQKFSFYNFRSIK